MTTFFGRVSNSDDGGRLSYTVYSVFRRPRSEEDRRVGAVAAEMGLLSSDDKFFAVSPNEEDGRALLVIDGCTLYAVPTVGGGVAWSLIPYGAGGATTVEGDGVIVAADETEDRLIFYGLVPDDVEAVEVFIDGVGHEAKMGENAFAVRVENDTLTNVSRVVLRRRDGSETEFPMGLGEY